MLRKFKTVLSTTILVVATIVSNTAMAAINPNIIIDEDNQKVTISGVLENVGVNTDITLTVVKRYDGKGLESVNIYDLSDKQKKSLYMREIQSSDGKFSFEFTPRDKSGSYDYYINYTNNETAYKDNFTFVISSDKTDNLALINEGNVDEIIKKINNNIDGAFAGIALTYNTISSDERKRDVIQSIASREDDFDDFSDAIKEINRLSIIAKFIDTADVDIISKNSEKAGIDKLDSYSVFLQNNENSVFQTEVASRLNKIKLTDDFNELFSRAVYLSMIHNAKNSTQISGIIDRINKNTSLNVDKYISLKDTTDIDGKIVGQYYTSSELEEFIANYKKPSAIGGSSSPTVSGVKAPGNISSITSTPTNNTVTEKQDTVIFNDVPLNHWAYSSIEVLKKRDIISGNEKGEYEPERNISRKEFVKIAMNLFELENAKATCNFKDVKKDDWSYEYIATAYSYGVISGKTEETFAPDDNITREEAAHILYNVISLENSVIPKISEIKAFSDLDDISEYARGSVLSFCAGGIIDGYADNTLRPKNNITRAECAQLVVNLLKNIR